MATVCNFTVYVCVCVVSFPGPLGGGRRAWYTFADADVSIVTGSVAMVIAHGFCMLYSSIDDKSTSIQ